MPAPLADLLPRAEAFILAVLRASEAGPLSWVDVNRLAARWLRPAEGDTSRLGHAVVVEMSRHGLLDVEFTTAADGAVMVARASNVARSAPTVSERLAA